MPYPIYCVLICILFSELFAALDRQIFAMMERTLDKLWRCIECGKTATGKSDVTRHIEAIHLQGHPGFVCQLCGEAVKTRNAMRQHRKLKHSQIMYWYCWNITLQICSFLYRNVSNVTVVILALLQDISTPGYRSWKMMLASYVLFAIRLLFRRATWRGDQLRECNVCGKQFKNMNSAKSYEFVTQGSKRICFLILTQALIGLSNCYWILEENQQFSVD